MVYKSEAIVRQVLEAKTDAEVRIIIENYLSSLQDRTEKGRIDKKYTRDILMALKYYKSIETQPERMEKLKTAVQVVKVVHAQATEGLW